MINLSILLTAIAALVTAVVTYISILELKRNRKVSYLPLLKILNINCKFMYTCENNKWSSLRDHNFSNIDIYNYGNGPAIDVEYNWFIDFEEFILQIKKFDPHNLIKLERKNQFFSIENSYHNLSQLNSTSIAIQPIQVSKNENTYFPQIIKDLLDVFFRLAYINAPNNDNLLFSDTLPKIKLEIKYKDLNDYVYTQNYHVLIRFRSAKFGDTEKEIDVIFEFLSKK